MMSEADRVFDRKFQAKTSRVEVPNRVSKISPLDLETVESVFSLVLWTKNAVPS